MDIKDSDIKEKFRITDSLIIIDEDRKEESMSLFLKKIDEKQVSILHHKGKILLQQARYMDKSAMITHIIVCIIVIVIAALMGKNGATGDEIIFSSMLLSGVLGMISIAQVSRIFFSGIAELSESCYFNVKQIVAFQMLLSGIMNLTMLFFVILFVGLWWKMALLQIGLYILVPFVVAQCCCLRALLSEAGRKNSFLLIMVGSFVTIFYMLLASIPALYQMTALTIWGVSFIMMLYHFS